MTTRFWISTVTSITTLIAAYFVVMPGVAYFLNDNVWSGFPSINLLVGGICAALTLAFGAIGRLMDKRTGVLPSPISNMGILIGAIVLAIIVLSQL